MCWSRNCAATRAPGILRGTCSPRRPSGCGAATIIAAGLGVHVSWVGDLGGWWDETSFHETRDTGFLLARLDELWQRVPRY